MMIQLRLGSVLLLTSMLGGWPALAQTPPRPPVTFDEEPPAEEEVEIVAPGTGGLQADEIVVIGRNIPNVIRTTPQVVSVLSQAEIARTGEGDIAGALKRVTGLSLVSDKYVYVRGLGERYSAALLNGLPLPSPEPLKRVIPLDLFPTSVISSSIVQKSFTPNFPGEFGGGVINLTTRSIPTERFLEVGISAGGNSVTTGLLGYTYFGSRTDFTGFDDGTRRLPAPIRAANRTGKRLEVGSDFDLETVQRATASLVNAPTTLIQRNDNIPANMGFGFAAGNSWEVGENLFGLVVSGGWDNSWRTQGGFQQVAGGVAVIDGEEGLDADQDYRFLSTNNNIRVNGLLGASFEFGEHKIRATNFFVRDVIKEARMQRGFDRINVGDDDEVLRSFTSWFQRQLYTSQLVGEFKFGDLSITARGAYAESERKSPYERSDSYRRDRSVGGKFVNDLTQNGNFARIAFSTLIDEVVGANLDAAYRLTLFDRPFVFSAGYGFYDNYRESERRDYRYVRANGAALPIAVAQQRIDFLLSDYNVYTYGVVLREVSGAEGAAFYAAGLRVHAGYLQFDGEILDGLKINGGVRYERGNQFVSPRGLFATDPPLPQTRIERDYFLPGGTITWNFAPDMQIRLAGSRTIARPQFREQAPQPYLDIDTDRTAFGNQYLVDSQLLNAEGRYEWYIGEQDRITLGGFFKRVRNPIEAVSFESGGTFLITFANAPRARLIGGEAEFVKFFPLDGLGLGLLEERRFLVNANYTYTRSKLLIREGDTTINTAGSVIAASDLFIDGTPLTGQSDHVANLELGFSHRERLSEQTILLGYASERVTQRGPTGTPDYRERPGFQLDFVWREAVRLGRRPVELKFEARNLTNTDYREFQRLNRSRIFINQYERGRDFSFSLNVAF
ncbi:MAG: TonB-dependent receptor [Sphingomonadaceae bacterium]|uniref:TonB-dependent receptor plug domain-containing protein n=1 Tax=Thermaurantiacus sp. TaxID=2820283 RepID=UPI00298F29F3|nr:TonB-dependent receptor plug domain-containing protein [Thermaurantiacus sp.]MCS6987445.1 TonB-dependent receptor [Sphingomonadaceae bacterium]MDW8415365.1 TonB-dependent receptor [Thermaurantiacus sp.]